MTVFEELERRLQADDLRPSRPRILTVPKLFVLLICMALTNRNLHLNTVPIMLRDINDVMPGALGIYDITENQVYYLFDRIHDHLNIEWPTPDNRPGRSTHHIPFLQSILDAAADSTSGIRAGYVRKGAIDATRIHKPARAIKWRIKHEDLNKPTSKQKKYPVYPDPDVTFHTMPEEDKRGNKDYRPDQGWGLTSIVNVIDGDHIPQTVSAFAVSDMVFSYTSEHVMLRPVLAHLSESTDITDVLADRGYSGHPGSWIVAKRHGMNFIVQLTENHQKVHNIYDGVRAVDDVLVCPYVPDKNLSILGLSGDELTRRVEDRAPYTLRLHGKPLPDGSCRAMCPAKAGRVRCPFVSESLRLDPGLPTVETPDKPEFRICAAKGGTITLPASMVMFLQKYTHGSKGWKSRIHARNTVESSYRLLKSNTSGNLTGDELLVQRLVKNSLLIMCKIIGENVKRIANKVRRHAGDRLETLTARFAWLDSTSPAILAINEAHKSERRARDGP